MNIINFNFLSNLEYCKEIVNGVTRLLLYSHIPVTIIVLIVSLYVYIYNKNLLSRILLFIGITFSIWTTLNVGIWLTYDKASILMALWAPIELFSVLLFILNFAFIYLFIKKTKVPIWIPIFSFLALLPILFALSTRFNLTGYDLGECIAIEYQPLQTYVLLLKIIISLMTLGVAIYGYIKTNDKVLRNQIRLLCLGTIIFLSSFFIAGYIAESTGNYSYEFYGLFGMIFFVAILVNLIVRFKMFGLKVITGQILVISLITLIGSLLFVITSIQAIIITAITLFLVIILGYQLIRSIKNEIEAKEKLQKLTIELAKSNEKLKAFDTLKSKFLSLASHQLRNPISAIINCTSMFLGGDFGKIDDTQKDMLSQMYDRAKGMNDDVEKYLTTAKVDQGGLQYNLEKLDIEDFAQNITEQQKLAVEKRKLTISFETDERPPYFVNGDKVQLKQVLQNLIDNSMKFTKVGWIKVKLSKVEDGKRIRVAISDSGMGIKPEIMPTLFKEFARGEGAKVDVGGSGIGIYLAKEIIEKGHKGKIWAESEGAGKGSAFIFELPLYLENKK